MKTHAQLVIIGAGIVGCSVAYHLARKGWQNVVVLDQGRLPEAGGSTSHAPGLVFQTNGSQAMCKLAQRTVAFYDSLKLDSQPCWYGVGSMEVARTPQRLDDLHRRKGWAAAWGLQGEVISPAQAKLLNPLLDETKIFGAYHVPSDGIAKAIRLCTTMMNACRAQGMEFHGETEVTGFDIRDGRVAGVQTSQGDISADLVLICAGIWGPKVGKLAGVPIPLIPVEHQLARTAALPQLAGETREVVNPILRDQDRAMYYRQWGDAYAIGNYQHEPLLVEADAILPPAKAPIMPSVREWTQQHFDNAWRDARELLPALNSAPIDYKINGMFSFTPDGNPIMGESRVKNLWVAEAVWVTQAGGVGEAMANWLADGDPGMDLRDCDMHRFEAHVPAPAYVRKRGATQYDEVYDLLHPLQQMAQPRPLRVSPFYQRQKELGAMFFESRGWERPQWYEVNAQRSPTPDPSPKGGGESESGSPPLSGEGSGVGAGNRDNWASQFWSPIAASEAKAARERACLFDMTSLTRFEVQGKGALAFLQSLTTNQIDKPAGSATYTLMLNEHGCIKSDITVARLEENHFQVAVNGLMDLDWMQRHLPDDGSVTVRDITPGTCAIGLWGPAARNVAQSLTDDDLSNTAFPYFTAKKIFIGEVPVTALRVSYIGELGWELYTTADYGLRLWDVLWQAGAQDGIFALGRAAFESMRLEKGYRLWGNEMHTEHNPYEAGLGWTVKLDKGEFIGRTALLNLPRKKNADGKTVVDVQRKLCCLVLDEGKVVMGKEPVYADGAIAGYVTSAAFGYTAGKSIAYSYLLIAHAVEGARVEVEYFGKRIGATVTKEPLFDPKGERLKG